MPQEDQENFLEQYQAADKAAGTLSCGLGFGPKSVIQPCSQVRPGKVKEPTSSSFWARQSKASRLPLTPISTGMPEYKERCPQLPLYLHADFQYK